MNHPQFVRLTLSSILGAATILIGIVAWTDPYWVLRQHNYWTDRWQGHNRALDIRLRHAKALQLLSRQPDTIIIGSSRVYRGMNTELPPFERTYNLGISGLRIREARAFIIHSLRWTSVKRIIFGLDYFMFDHDRPQEAGFDPGLASASYLLRAVPTSYLSYTAISDSYKALRGKRRGDGYWTWSGFKRTNQRTEEDIREILSSLYALPMKITKKEYRVFRELLEDVAEAEVNISLFVSPMHHSAIRRLKEQGEYARFGHWRQQVEKIAATAGLKLHDFSESNPWFQEDISQGSSSHWIDSSHYSPAVGSWVYKLLKPGIANSQP